MEYDGLGRVFENLDKIDHFLKYILEEKNQILQLAIGDDSGISQE